MTDLRNELADGRSRAFCTHQVDVRSAAQGNDGKKEYEYAHTADPVREASPEQVAARHGFDVVKDARTGRRKTGDGLKERVRK